MTRTAIDPIPAEAGQVAHRRWSRRATGQLSRTLDRAAALVAIGVLVSAAVITTVEQQAVDGEAAPSSPAGVNGERRPFDTTFAETLVAAYGGVPYTYPSDIRFEDGATGSDFTLRNVEWHGKPFRHPVYYGVRVARWAPGNRSGVMVDFLHSKAISDPLQQVEVGGAIDGKTARSPAKVGELFRTLEFSHGHNMVMLTGLFRLGALAPRLSPYAGVGLGVALPHTEIRRQSETRRTYEYQYAGPVGQGLIGLELRLPRSSVFVEYKFTFADYRVPVTRRDGDLLVTDVWRQLSDWWSGKTPPGGHAATRLVSHNVIAGAGARFGSP